MPKSPAPRGEPRPHPPSDGDRASNEPSIGEAIVGLGRLADLTLANTGLSVTQYRILHHLRRGRAIQSDLAFEITVSKQSVTRIVDGLVEKRYITRRPDSADRRRVIHALTTRGRRALDLADSLIEQNLMFTIGHLDSAADIETALHGIKLFGQAKRLAFKAVTTTNAHINQG